MRRIFRSLPGWLLSLAACGAIAATLFCSCHHIDNHRLHVAYVNISFVTVGDWNVYGVSGAGQYRRFILQERMPAGFPYTAMSATGLGGVLLCSSYTTELIAYDMACPVECKSDIRVFVNDDNEAECPVCGSRYDIFQLPGYPIAGPAARDGFGLQVYRVGPGSAGEYMKVSL